MNIRNIQFGFLPTKRNIKWFREDLNGENGNDGRLCAFLTIFVNVIIGVTLIVGICYLIALKGI